MSDTTSLIQGNRKNHNFRILTKGVQCFYRIYYHLIESGKEITDSRLYSFLAYYLVANSGFIRDGKHILKFEDKDIKEYYPKYSAKEVTRTMRTWIITGIWDKEELIKEL